MDEGRSATVRCKRDGYRTAGGWLDPREAPDRGAGLARQLCRVRQVDDGREDLGVDECDTGRRDAGAGAHGCIPTPGVQNSMLARGDSVFLAGPRIYGTSGHPRGNLPFYRSTDGGSKWRTVALLQEGGSAPGDGYSSMVNLDSVAIGIIYSAGKKILFQRQPVEY